MAIETGDRAKYDRTTSFAPGTELVNLADYRPKLSIYQRAFGEGTTMSEINTLCRSLQDAISRALYRGWVVYEGQADLIKAPQITIHDNPINLWQQGSSTKR